MSADNRFSVILVLLGLGAVFALPEILSLLGAPPPAETLGWLGAALENHRFREITGFVLLGLILFELLLMAQKRTRWLHKIVRGHGHRMRLIHMCIGIGLVPVIVLHTGGRWGQNLNAWLLTTCLMVVATALLGKAMETFFLGRLRKRAKPATAAAGPGNAPQAPVQRKRPWSMMVHRAWYRLHVVLVGSLVVLLGFHIFAVYYF